MFPHPAPPAPLELALLLELLAAALLDAVLLAALLALEAPPEPAAALLVLLPVALDPVPELPQSPPEPPSPSPSVGLTPFAQAAPSTTLTTKPPYHKLKRGSLFMAFFHVLPSSRLRQS